MNVLIKEFMYFFPYFQKLIRFLKTGFYASEGLVSQLIPQQSFIFMSTSHGSKILKFVWWTRRFFVVNFYKM